MAGHAPERFPEKDIRANYTDATPSSGLRIVFLDVKIFQYRDHQLGCKGLRHLNPNIADLTISINIDEQNNSSLLENVSLGDKYIKQLDSPCSGSLFHIYIHNNNHFYTAYPII